MTEGYMNRWPLGPDGKCRICGLGYVPEEPEDVEFHVKKHEAILKGGLPLDVRNFLKAWGWAVPPQLTVVSGAWFEKSGSLGHPSGRDLLGRARTRPGEADDEPADPILPQSGLPSQRPG